MVFFDDDNMPASYYREETGKSETSTFCTDFLMKILPCSHDAISGQKITWNLAISETMLFLKIMQWKVLKLYLRIS